MILTGVQHAVMKKALKEVFDAITKLYSEEGYEFEIKTPPQADEISNQFSSYYVLINASFGSTPQLSPTEARSSFSVYLKLKELTPIFTKLGKGDLHGEVIVPITHLFLEKISSDITEHKEKLAEYETEAAHRAADEKAIIALEKFAKNGIPFTQEQAKRILKYVRNGYAGPLA